MLYRFIPYHKRVVVYILTLNNAFKQQQQKYNDVTY